MKIQYLKSLRKLSLWTVKFVLTLTTDLIKFQEFYNVATLFVKHALENLGNKEEIFAFSVPTAGKLNQLFH